MLFLQLHGWMLLFYLVCILCSCKVKSLLDDIESNGLLVFGWNGKGEGSREQEEKGKGVQTQPISLMPRQLFRPFNPIPISALISLPSAGNLCISSAIVRFWYLQYIIAVRWSCPFAKLIASFLWVVDWWARLWSSGHKQTSRLALL